MSVVVRMEMPKNCFECPFSIIDDTADGAWCNALGKQVYYDRDEGCPIICSLPEGHGRLVDERELFVRCRPVKNFDNPDAPVIVKGAIIQSQTIVPADIERSVYERKQKKYTNWIGEEMVEQQIDKDVSRFADGEWWKEMQE